LGRRSDMFAILFIFALVLGRISALVMSIQPAVTIGDSANLQWTLAQNDSPTFNLVLKFDGDAPTSSGLPPVNSLGQKEGKVPVFFSSALQKGSYHIEAFGFSDSASGLGKAKGSSNEFELVEKSKPASDDKGPEQHKATSTETKSLPTSKGRSSEVSPTPTSSSSRSLSDSSSSPSQLSSSIATISTTSTSGFTVSLETSVPSSSAASEQGVTSSNSEATSVSASLSNLSSQTRIPMIVGGVIGALVALALVILGLFLFVRRYRRRNEGGPATFYRERMIRSTSPTHTDADIRRKEEGEEEKY